MRAHRPFRTAVLNTVDFQMSDLNLQLLPFVHEDDIAVFSCGHVIPRTNLQCIVVGKGPRNIDLQFKFKDRDNDAVVSIICRLIVYAGLSILYMA